MLSSLATLPTLLVKSPLLCATVTGSGTVLRLKTTASLLRENTSSLLTFLRHHVPFLAIVTYDLIHQALWIPVPEPELSLPAYILSSVQEVQSRRPQH